MDIWIGLLMVIIAVAGFFAGRYFAPNQQEINDLNDQLAETRLLDVLKAVPDNCAP